MRRAVIYIIVLRMWIIIIIYTMKSYEQTLYILLKHWYFVSLKKTIAPTFIIICKKKKNYSSMHYITI